MSIIRINLNDQVSAWLTKTNLLSTGVGDIADLPVEDSNIVDAINRITTSQSGLLSTIKDSAEIVDIARNSLLGVDDGGLGSFSYNVNTGAFTYAGPNQGDIRSLFSVDSTLDYDIANGVYRLAPDKIVSNNFKNAVSLSIYDSTGTEVKKLYSPGY